MRVPLDWLAEWIELPRDERGRSDVEALVERLTLGGLEIEGLERTGPALEGVRVGRVVSKQPHPQADRLSVCVVDDGEGEHEVVCGAPNVAAGQKVAFAPVGVRLPDGTRLKRARIRGVVSQGMICSARELGLGEDHAGILELPADAPVGAPVAEALGTGTTVLDLEITPNRGDWASILGIAREVRAHFGGELCWPPHTPPESGPPAAEAVRVRIEDAAGCARYVARVVRGVRVGASPPWLAARLEAAGLRPVNNVVDVTNLVLLELGQPLHAFDLARLRGGEVRVRAAAPGEKLVTLDGQSRDLLAEDLVIADAEVPVAVAGVMGGAESEVGEATRDVLLESAAFHPTRIRRTARRLGLRSEASYRFERGVDPEGVARAADRAALLLAELCDGAVAPGRVEARGAAPSRVEEVSLDPRRVNRLLGTSLEPSEVAACLERADFRVRRAQGGAEGARLVAAVPSYRSDVEGPHDLVEEVGRIWGYDRIPTTLPVAPLRPVERPRRQELVDRAKTSLAGQGLAETVSFPFARPEDLDGLGLAPGDARRRTVGLTNPLVAGEGVLRTSLVPSLLRIARHNRARQVETVRIFEIAPVFLADPSDPGGQRGQSGEGAPGGRGPQGGARLPREPLQLAALIARGEKSGLWEPREPIPLFFLAKGLAERVLLDLGYAPGCRPGGEGVEPYLQPGAACPIEVGDRVIGAVGELHPDAAGQFGIDVLCAVVELDLGALAELPAARPRVREVSRQPRVRRDLAVLLDRDQPAGEVLQAIRKTAGGLLVSAGIFDRYEGRGVPEGKVSLAFRLELQRPDRALEEREVAKLVDRVVNMLEQRFGGLLREGPGGERR